MVKWGNGSGAQSRSETREERPKGQGPRTQSVTPSEELVKRLCPLRLLANAIAGNRVHLGCIDERCAWWLLGGCAIALIAEGGLAVAEILGRWEPV